jgi:hypothetical protein
MGPGCHGALVGQIRVGCLSSVCRASFYGGKMLGLEAHVYGVYDPAFGQGIQ